MSEVLRELVVALSLDSDNFARNMRTINQQIKEAESTFRLAGAGIDKFEKSVKGTEAKLSMLGDKLTQQNRAVEQYARALVAANQKLTDSYDRQEKMKASLNDARAEYDRLKTEVGNAAQEYRKLASSLGENDSATIAAKANLERYKQELQDAHDKVKLLEGQITSNTKALQNNADAVSKATTNLNNAKAAVRETEAEIKKLTEQLYRMESKWTQAGEALAAFSKKADTMGKAMSKTGKTMTAAITTPIVALGTTAVKASIDFESAFTSVRKTVEASEEEFDSLSNSVKQMSTQVATSGADIAEVMAVAGQLGIANKHLVDFTRTMIDLGNSTDIVADQAASTLAKFANITRMDQSQFTNLGSALVDLGNNFATTESAIMEMAMRLAAAGHQVGLSESQILGFATALSSVGIEAQMGGSAFSKALVKMEVASATGGDALKDFGKVAGMTAQEFKKLWDNDPAAAFQAFIVGLSRLDDAGESAIATLEEIGIKEVRLRDTLLRATNATELFSRAQNTANKAWAENTALAVEANKRYATTESRLINLKNTAMLFAQQIGDDLNPTIQQLIDKGNALLQSFLGMDESQRMAIIKFAAFAAAAGPAILVLGKTVSAISQVTSVLGKVNTGIGKFSANVKLAGGGFTGFTKTILSSKLAVAALAAALVYGAVKLYDYASGAKAVREALEGMSKTAEKWKSDTADTFYGTGQGLSFFGMSKEDFVRTARDAEGWLSGLLAVWADGKKETDEIVTEWSSSFKALTGSTREQLQALNQTAKEAGYTSISSQLEADIAKLDQMDAEIERLLKKRKNKLFSDKDKVRLQELIDAREAIEVKYKLSPLDAEGFDTIRQKLEAEVARAQARGKLDADVAVYENAMVAAAEGMAAINAELDAQYDKEYALIALISDSAEKQQALSDLNEKYNQNRKAAAEEYAKTLQGMVMPVWNQEDIQQAGADIDALTEKLRAYSIAAANNDTLGMGKVLEEMNALTASMDEGALVEYLGVLTQIQELLDSGMTQAEVQALFPEIDVSGQMEQIAALAKFVEDHKSTLTGLSGIFSGAVPEEMLKIATDLDMTGAQARWDAFAADPGVITTQAVVDGYSEAEGILQLEPKVTAFINEYTEIPEGASTAALTPTGLLAYVSTYAEAVTGADVSGLTPEHVTAMVSAYQELARGADTSMLSPSEITAYVSKYLEESRVNTDGLTPEGITAFVLAYEEVTGGASTTSLTPSNVAAMVTKYLGAKNIDVSKLSEPQIDAIVTAYADATNVDKTALKAELEAIITAYKDQEGVQKPTYIESQIGIVGYDLKAYNAFVANNPVTLTGIVRVGQMYEDPSDLLKNPQASFWENGKEIPVNLVPANKIDANTLIAYDADGTLHVLITPQIEGSTESVRKAAEDVISKYVTTSIFGNESHNNWGWLNNLLGSDLLTWMGNFNMQLEAFQRNQGSWATLWGLLDTSALKGLDSQISGQFSGENLANFTTYVTEMVAAIKNGQEVSKEDLQNLKDIVDFLNNLQLTNTGENIRSGVAQGMTEAGWDADAETVASKLEAALNAALGIQSPSARVKPVGENVAAGVGTGMTEYDLAADAATMASGLESAISAAITADTLSTIGAGAAEGLANAMTSYSMASTGTTVASNVKDAVADSLNLSTLHSIGLNAMAGLKAGITAGQSGVVAAMRAAAKAAVNAAKSELKIKSPSVVFREEVGRMAMKGLGLGALLESKAQAKIIRNAARFLTDEAKEGAIAHSSNDNRRTYNQQSSVTLTGNTFYVRDEQDIRSLAIEIASLTKRQQRGKGMRMV